MTRKQFWSWLVVPIVALVIVSADRLSKNWVLNNLALYESYKPIPALGDYLAFTHTTNTGAAFGLLRDRSSLFIIIALVVIVAILAYSRHLSASRFLVRLSLGLQLGGAIGNLIDRIQHGPVTDFIDLGIGRHRFFVFNVADSAITVGVIFLAILMLLEKEQPVEPTEHPQEQEA